MILFDIETNNLLKQLTTVHCMGLLSITTTRQTTLEPNDDAQMFGPHQLEQGIRQLKNASTLVGHNIIGFDLPALWKVTGEWDRVPLILDTLVLSRTLWPERPWGHSLEGWGEHLGYPKIDFDDYSEYSEEMLTYCERDVLLNYKVLLELEKEYGATFTEGYSVYR